MHHRLAFESHAACPFTAATVAAVALLSIAIAAQKPDASSLASEPACQTLTPTALGGPSPRGRSTLVLRWLGTSNQEIAFRDTVVLLDAYYDRAPRTRSIGFTRDQVKRADAILIGHGHGDHMADAQYVASRTNARVFGGPPTIETARKLGLPEKQAVLVKGGEVEKFNGFTVQAILARHADLTAVMHRIQIFGPALAAAMDPPLSEQEKAHATEINARGTSEPRVVTEGTIAYLFTFDGGFKLLWLDSAGAITEGERQVMNQVKETDVALVAYQGNYLAKEQVAATLPLIKLFNPRYYIPTHHDEIAGTFWDQATYPLFMAIRDEMPQTKTIDPLYRTPICIDVSRKDVYVGK